VGSAGVNSSLSHVPRTDAGSETKNVSRGKLEGTVAKENRGFASMDRNKQREIASKGGKAAHQKGAAHEWTKEQAREAGRKGGRMSHQRGQP
jgi:general stress protein YciG